MEIYQFNSDAEKHVIGSISMGLQVSYPFVKSGMKPAVMVTTGLTRINFTNNWQKYGNGSTLLCAELS